MHRSVPRPDTGPFHVGLARAAAGSGDNEQAVVYDREVQAPVPEEADRRNLEDLFGQWCAPAKP
jgi:hypothetical protein